MSFQYDAEDALLSALHLIQLNYHSDSLYSVVESLNAEYALTLCPRVRSRLPKISWPDHEANRIFKRLLADYCSLNGVYVLPEQFHHDRLDQLFESKTYADSVLLRVRFLHWAINELTDRKIARQSGV